MKVGWFTALVLAAAVGSGHARGHSSGGGHYSGGYHSHTGSSSRTHSSRYCATCLRDSHGRIERSRSAKDQFRHTHPCPSTGRTSGACPGYVVDHVTALKHGGSDDPSNMQWQSDADARAKDRWE